MARSSTPRRPNPVSAHPWGGMWPQTPVVSVPLLTWKRGESEQPPVWGGPGAAVRALAVCRHREALLARRVGQCQLSLRSPSGAGANPRGLRSRSWVLHVSQSCQGTHCGPLRSALTGPEGQRSVRSGIAGRSRPSWPEEGAPCSGGIQRAHQSRRVSPRVPHSPPSPTVCQRCPVTAPSPWPRPQQPLLSEAFLSPDVLRHRLCERPRGHALQSQCSAESLGDSVVLPTPAAGSSVRSGLGTAPPAPVSVCACAPPLPLPRTQALSISHQEARRYRDDTWGSLKGQKAKGGISQSKYSKWKRKTCAQPPR